MKVERRDTPYLTQAMRKELTEVYLPRYERPLAAVLPALRMIQHEYSWVPFQAMEEVAAFLKVPAADVLDAGSFYEEFWLRPRGKHLIAVCRSIACEVCGHKEVTGALREHLGIEVGETTGDNKFTLIEVECIGACGGAPAMLVDEVLVQNVSVQNIARQIGDALSKSHH